MSRRKILTSLLLLTLTIEVKTQFYDFFNNFHPFPTTTKTITRRRHYEFYITPDEGADAGNKRRNYFGNDPRYPADASEETDADDTNPYSYYVHDKDSRTEKPRATVKIKSTEKPTRQNQNGDNSSQNRNKPDLANNYYKEQQDEDTASWDYAHNMNKRKPALNDNHNIFNINSFKPTTGKTTTVNNNRYPNNDNSYNNGRPDDNTPGYYTQRPQHSYTTLRPIFNNDRQTIVRRTTTTAKPSHARPGHSNNNQRRNEENNSPSSYAPANNQRPDYNPGRPSNTRPEYSGYPDFGSSRPSNNGRPDYSTARPDFDSGYPNYNSGYPNNGGYLNNGGYTNNGGYLNNGGYPNNGGYLNGGYPNNNGRPVTQRPGVKPTRPPQGPPITNRPVTARPVYNGGDDDAIRFPDEDAVTPELVIGPDEDRMSESQRRRYVDYLEKICTTYKAGDTTVVAAIPLLPSPEPVRVNVSECGPSSVPLVVGGRVLDIEQVPHNAALGWKNVQQGGYSWKCGGSLISDQFVLTAGHCASQERDNTVSIGPPRVVQLGSSYINDPGALTVKVAKSITHPKYKPPRSYYDLAILKLKSRVTFSEMIRPACIGVAPPAEQAVIATGWGKTQFGGDPSDVLRGVSLPIWDMGECKRVLGSSRKLPEGPSSDSQVCAGEKAGGKDTCQGDSGGPIQMQDGCVWRVVGVTSLGRSCGAAGTPAVYAVAQRAFIGAVLNSY